MEEEEKKNIKKDETVSIARKDYDFLIEQIQTLSKEVKNIKGGVVELSHTKNHVVRLRTWNGALVLGFSKSWQVKDPVTKEVRAMINLTVEDEDKLVEVELVEFMRNSSFVDASVLQKRLIDEGVKEEGLVEVKNVADYSTSGTGVKIMSKTTTPVYTLDLKLEDGRELSINEEFVN